MLGYHEIRMIIPMFAQSVKAHTGINHEKKLIDQISIYQIGLSTQRIYFIEPTVVVKLEMHKGDFLEIVLLIERMFHRIGYCELVLVS